MYRKQDNCNTCYQYISTCCADESAVWHSYIENFTFWSIASIGIDCCSEISALNVN